VQILKELAEAFVSADTTGEASDMLTTGKRGKRTVIEVTLAARCVDAKRRNERSDQSHAAKLSRPRLLRLRI